MFNLECWHNFKFFNSKSGFLHWLYDEPTWKVTFYFDLLYNRCRKYYYIAILFMPKPFTLNSTSFLTQVSNSRKPSHTLHSCHFNPLITVIVWFLLSFHSCSRGHYPIGVFLFFVTWFLFLCLFFVLYYLVFPTIVFCLC